MAGNYIAAAVFVELANTRAKDNGPGQSRPTTHTVDNGGTSKVDKP